MDNATENIAKLNSLIKQSTTILVVCHTGADPDALSSLIALKTILMGHYGKKNVLAVAERIPASLSFIPGYKEVTNGSIVEALEKNPVDLLICLDFSQMHLASKTDGELIQEYITKSGIPMVIIDHHPESYKNLDADLYLNLDPTSTGSNLHLIFHKGLQFPILPKVADLLLFGIIADTNRFKYKYGAPSQATILHITSEILDHSQLSIEEISNRLERLDSKTLRLIHSIIKNIKFLDETFAYTSISVEEIEQENLEKTKLGDAALYVANSVISMVDTAMRGVVVYPHLLEENTYTARFRSCSPDFPVDIFAKKLLTGGGHPQAAAGRVKATSIEDAVEQVLKVVRENS